MSLDYFGLTDDLDNVEYAKQRIKLQKKEEKNNYKKQTEKTIFKNKFLKIKKLNPNNYDYSKNVQGEFDL